MDIDVAIVTTYLRHLCQIREESVTENLFLRLHNFRRRLA